jgi:hypothetical protein
MNPTDRIGFMESMNLRIRQAGSSGARCRGPGLDCLQFEIAWRRRCGRQSDNVTELSNDSELIVGRVPPGMKEDAAAKVHAAIRAAIDRN